MCDTADGPAGWQSTVDAAAWQPQPGQEPGAGAGAGARSSKGFTVPQRAQHMPSWGLELIRAGAGYPCVLRVCVFNEDTSRGGRERRSRGGTAGLAQALQQIRDRYEGHERGHGHVCVCVHAQLQTPLIAPANGRAVLAGGAHTHTQSHSQS